LISPFFIIIITNMDKQVLYLLTMQAMAELADGCDIETTS